MRARQEYRSARRQLSNVVESIFGSRARYERIGWLLGDFRRPRPRRMSPDDAALVPAYREIDRIYSILHNHAERIERLEAAIFLGDPPD